MHAKPDALPLAARCRRADSQRRRRAERGAHQRNPLRQRRHRRRRSHRSLRARGHGPHRLAGRALQRQRRRCLRHATRCTGIVPATCGTRGVVVLNYPVNGIQNGAPDGIALVEQHRRRWSNSFPTKACSPRPTARRTASRPPTSACARTAPNRSANSLARNAAGTWSGPAASTFGACNDDGDTPPPAEVASVTVAPASATVSVGATLVAHGHRLRRRERSRSPARRSPGPAAIPPIATVSARVWSPALPRATRSSSRRPRTASPAPRQRARRRLRAAAVRLPHQRNPLRQLRHRRRRSHRDRRPRGHRSHGFQLVLYNGNGGVAYRHADAERRDCRRAAARAACCVVTYPPDGIQNGAPDGIALVNCTGQVLEFLSYEGTFTATSGPAAGPDVHGHRRVSRPTPPIGTSLQRNSADVWAAGASSFGACNPEAPTPVGNTLQFSGRVPQRSGAARGLRGPALRDAAQPVERHRFRPPSPGRRRRRRSPASTRTA